MHYFSSPFFHTPKERQKSINEKKKKKKKKNGSDRKGVGTMADASMDYSENDESPLPVKKVRANKMKKKFKLPPPFFVFFLYRADLLRIARVSLGKS